MACVRIRWLRRSLLERTRAFVILAQSSREYGCFYSLGIHPVLHGTAKTKRAVCIGVLWAGSVTTTHADSAH
jgi:hypothetical protein